MDKRSRKVLRRISYDQQTYKICLSAVLFIDIITSMLTRLGTWEISCGSCTMCVGIPCRRDIPCRREAHIQDSGAKLRFRALCSAARLSKEADRRRKLSLTMALKCAVPATRKRGHFEKRSDRSPFPTLPFPKGSSRQRNRSCRPEPRPYI